MLFELIWEKSILIGWKRLQTTNLDIATLIFWKKKLSDSLLGMPTRNFSEKLALVLFTFSRVPVECSRFENKSTWNKKNRQSKIGSNYLLLKLILSSSEYVLAISI